MSTIVSASMFRSSRLRGCCAPGSYLHYLTGEGVSREIDRGPGARVAHPSDSPVDAACLFHPSIVPHTLPSLRGARGGSYPIYPEYPGSRYLLPSPCVPGIIHQSIYS